MELRVNKPALALAMGILVLALAGVGCGDDDSDTGGTGGTAGTAGTGGTGGTAGTGGGNVTIPECVANAGEVLADILPLTDECLTCICTADTTKTEACTNNAMCWPFVKCAVVQCLGEEVCAVEMCTDSFTGYRPAMMLDSAIRGCQTTCFPSADDGGTEDSGT